MPVKTCELTLFRPLPPDASGSVSWIHIGDLHMTRAGEQNEIDLGRIVDVINDLYAGPGVSFVYLPGDIADDGSASAYSIVRSHLDRLSLPWCGVVGDHDVHEESFDNFRTYIAHDLTSAFTLGQYRFLRLNAFSEPRPDSFTIDAGQLAWIEEELRTSEQRGLRAVLLLHCYPSDLKQGGAALTRLIRSCPVLLVDMGHTHYNELSNDGHLLYSATRSTGQIEEGPVGFSVVTLDRDTVSWHFVPLDAPELVAITAPADRRLEVKREQSSPSQFTVRAKVWSRHPITHVTATLEGAVTELSNVAEALWSGVVPVDGLSPGQYRLTVQAMAESESPLASAIEIIMGPGPGQEYAPLDQDNAIGAWKERGILGTQLGPNKNGRKW
jgi:3',5'-cyclic-AMP phosphodiesterase